MKLKLQNSKVMIVHHNFTRITIKNKLFEINKEFEEFKFQQNLRMEFIER